MRARRYDDVDELQEAVRQEYPEVEPYGSNNHGGSVGVAMWMENRGSGIDVIVREAWLLNAAAQIGLSTIHRLSTKGAVEPDERIIAFFKESAEEGLPLSMYEFGRFLLFGWSVELDVERGTEFLKKSDRPEAWLSLATHASDIGDDVLFKEYLTRAAEYDMPQATYNLGVLAQEEGDFEEAIGYFEQTLRLDSGYQQARLELARMHMEGWGTEVDSERGIELMHAVAEGADGQLATLANVNLGMFYFKGIGVEQDERRGIELLEQALAEGSPHAGQVLESLTDR